MKAKPVKRVDREFKSCSPEEATHVILNLPGPIPYRAIPVILKGSRAGTPYWSWNGDTEKPTLKPSLLTETYQGENEICCHTWITDGKVQFLNDCSHEFAGKTVDLLEVDW